jgi:hypothetical protein
MTPYAIEKKVTEFEAWAVRTPKSLARTGSRGSQILNALALANAASANRIMTGVVDADVSVATGVDIKS